MVDLEKKFSKLISLPDVTRKIKVLKRQGKKIVFTNGCFDLIHPGHIKVLREAKQQGDILVVGLNSDRSIQSIKGKKRPILLESDRAHILSAIEFVDYIILFSDPTPLTLIEKIRPDVLVKGGDWKKQDIVGNQLVEKIYRVKLCEDCSTTGIIKKILQRYSHKR